MGAAWLAQAAPYNLGNCSVAVMRQEGVKGCLPDSAPRPVDLEPVYQSLGNARSVSGQSPSPGCGHARPVAQSQLLRLQVWVCPNAGQSLVFVSLYPSRTAGDSQPHRGRYGSGQITAAADGFSGETMEAAGYDAEPRPIRWERAARRHTASFRSVPVAFLLLWGKFMNELPAVGPLYGTSAPRQGEIWRRVGRWVCAA